MDVPDAGYRHVGKCEQLESLILMYCRNTTDVATEHITGLRKLSYYLRVSRGCRDCASCVFREEASRLRSSMHFLRASACSTPRECAFIHSRRNLDARTALRRRGMRVRARVANPRTS